MRLTYILVGKAMENSTNRGRFLCLLLVCCSWLLLATSTPTKRSIYIVHMDKSLMPKPFSSHLHWYSSIIDSLVNSRGPASPTETLVPHSNPSLVYTYDNAFHGFSALLSEEELEKLKNSPGFISSYMDSQAELDTTHTFEFLSLNPTTGLWPASDYGRDVIVGVIDTGVWPESDSFKDHGMTRNIPKKWKGVCQEGQEFNSSLCNLKLIGARYFNKGVIAAEPNVTIRMNSARDNDGHGTHTASTVAGNYVRGASFFGYGLGTARGMAPRARLAVYKVSWNEGRYASDVLAGMDQAVADGVDVMSISMGFRGIPLYEDPIAIASFGAMEKGVLVCASAGNRGPDLVSLHNGIPWALTVAAGSVDRWFAGTVTLGNGLTIEGWTLFPARAWVQDRPLLYNKTLSACNSTEQLSEAPESIIICDNIGFFDSQIRLVSMSNKPAAIVISNDSDVFRSKDFPFPGVVVRVKDSDELIKYAETATEPTATIKFQQTFVGIKRAPTVASYSSRGPARSNPSILKPDVMAPGTLILAATCPEAYATSIDGNIYLSADYTLNWGTSMACPHASGIAAMLKGAHPGWSPAAIRSAMVTTANPFDNTGNPILDVYFGFEAASPLAMGAGQVDPNKALDPGLVYDATPQDYVNHLCSMNFTANQIFTITRSSNHSCAKASFDLNYPSFIALYKNRRTKVDTFRRTVTNVGVGATVYRAVVQAPRGSEVTVSPEKLVFNKRYEKQSYSLRIQYKGDEKGSVTHGSLVWIEENGKHTVRSPIVVWWWMTDFY
ncbi:subtilisin-like protease SBT3 [Diospyros lotus]|uniref:subtilisin-like protease SBT3 n=1 Tax=Diospyros lotus TaxID=55363 RepID=UPI00225A4A08|nr:subtilisin-like protease SBT3 [Diospyros lotus]